MAGEPEPLSLAHDGGHPRQKQEILPDAAADRLDVLGPGHAGQSIEGRRSVTSTIPFKDYVELTERFIEERFPGAEVAVIGGSTARGTRTKTSDIDLLLIGDEVFADGASSLAGAWEYDSEVFEVFAYTYDAYTKWARGGIAQYRPVIVDLLLDGQEVRGSDALTRLREEWGAKLAEGPPITDHELAMRRYAITDLIDDLRDATDPLEQNVVAWDLFEKVADLMLLTDKHWIGTGKYLARRLRELSVSRTEHLTSSLLQGDLITFADRAEQELTDADPHGHAAFATVVSDKCRDESNSRSRHHSAE